MLRRFLFFGLVLPSLYGALSSSCGQDWYSVKEVMRFMGAQVTLPQQLLKIEDGLVSDYYCSFHLPILVHYYGPEECRECVLSNVGKNIDLYEWSVSSHSFELMVILAPSKEYQQDIIDRLCHLELGFPIFIDASHEIATQNIVPSDSRLHTFLLDYAGRPVCIGNPLSSKKTNAKFKKIIYSY